MRVGLKMKPNMWKDNMKKAFLVRFDLQTRVIADVPEGFSPNDCNLIIPEHEEAFSSIVEKAVNNIMDIPYNYLYNENAEVEEDTECPYGTLEEEEEEE